MRCGGRAPGARSSSAFGEVQTFRVWVPKQHGTHCELLTSKDIRELVSVCARRARGARGDGGCGDGVVVMVVVAVVCSCCCCW